MQNAILATSKLCKTFSSGGNQQHVLKNLDLNIIKGDFTVIMGPSGAGKSTLLYALSGMDKPTLGDVYFDGKEIGKLSNDKLAVFRRDNCGFVFQQMYLLDNMSILDNIMACGLLVSKNRNAVADRARGLLRRLNLDETMWRKFPAQVSGGEAQRAGIARALINEPKIVFADANPCMLQMSWEKTATTNIGFESNFLKQRLLLEFEYFTRKTSDMLDENIEHPYVYKLVSDNIKVFLERNIFQYDDYFNYPIRFVGPIAKMYSSILKDVAQSIGIHIDSIVETPMKGLIKYHIKELSGSMNR